MAQPDRDTIRRVLSADRIWCAYALADLQPDFAPYCRWYLAESDVGSAVALIFTGLEIPTLFTAGGPADVAAAVAQIDLPEQIYITIREEHFEHVSSLYDFGDDRRPMWRMSLPDVSGFRRPNAPGLRRLTGADSEKMRALYACGGPFAPDAFEPYQIDNGVFFGIANGDGTLVAAGGTHIVDWMEGIAAIGNMYTRPDCRGRGHATATLQAIVATLREDGVHDIVLNVDQRNQAARRLYERYGFEINCGYIEGNGRLIVG